MPNRFNDRENGESSHFPRRRHEQDRPFSERNFQSRPGERREGEWKENESIQGERDRSQHARRGQDIEESYGGFSGEHERGVFGDEIPSRERYQQHGEYERRRQYDPNYRPPESQRFSGGTERNWRDERYYDPEYSAGQRHSEYQQGPFFGKGPKDYRRSDQRIEEDINERLTQHPFIDATNIEVRVQNGEVLLSGTVDDRNAKRIAEDIVDSVTGVKEMQNQIRFKKKS